MSRSKPVAPAVAPVMVLMIDAKSGAERWIRPEFIAGVTFAQDGSEVVLTNLKSAIQITRDSGIKILEDLAEIRPGLILLPPL